MDPQPHTAIAETSLLPGLVDRFRGPLVGLIASWGASPADAIELAQETFAEAYLGRARFQGDWDDPGATGAWLRGIASNLHRSRLRARPRRLEALGEREVVDPGSDAPPASGEETPTERIRCALDRLRGPWRTVLTMRYVEDCDLPEIAGLLGIGVRAVEGRLRRARAELKRLLEEDPALTSDADEVPR